MLNLKLLNTALGEVSGDEFKVLYFIANTLSMKKEGSTRIYRELIADRLGWLDDDKSKYALNKVSKITESLVKKGYLVKNEVYSSPTKSVIYYSLPSAKKCTKVDDIKLSQCICCCVECDRSYFHSRGYQKTRIKVKRETENIYNVVSGI